VASEACHFTLNTHADSAAVSSSKARQKLNAFGQDHHARLVENTPPVHREFISPDLWKLDSRLCDFAGQRQPSRCDRSELTVTRRIILRD